MQITKVINNNVVVSLDKDGKEVVIMGRGLAFQRRAGQEIEEEKIEKIFRLESEDTLEQFKRLLEDLPLEYLQVSNEIISYAKEVLHTQLNHNIYLTLTDHISFAIDRHRKQQMVPNALYREVRRFYAAEFAVGMHALTLIREKVGVPFPEDEAASIALHIVNAEFDQKVSDTLSMTNMLQGMLRILERELQLPDNESLYMDQLSANLKFLAHRILRLPAPAGKRDLGFERLIQNHCPREYELAGRVRTYIREYCGRDMTDVEQVYLAIYIKNGNDTLQK